jgi:hypothetical protein
MDARHTNRKAATMSTTATFIVRRYRTGEAAPSLSLSFPGATEAEAFSEYVKTYGASESERYEVVTKGERHGKWMDAEAAAIFARRGQRTRSLRRRLR